LSFFLESSASVYISFGKSFLLGLMDRMWIGVKVLEKILVLWRSCRTRNLGSWVKTSLVSISLILVLFRDIFLHARLPLLYLYCLLSYLLFLYGILWLEKILMRKSMTWAPIKIEIHFPRAESSSFNPVSSNLLSFSYQFSISLFSWS